MDKNVIINKVKEFADKTIKNYDLSGWFDKNRKYVYFLSGDDARKEIYPLIDLITDDDLEPRPYEYSECIEQNSPIHLPQTDYTFETEIYYNSDGSYAEIIAKFIAPENESLIVNRIWIDIITKARQSYDEKRTLI